MAAPLDMEPAALSLELLPTDPLLLILSFLDYRDLMRCGYKAGREGGWGRRGRRFPGRGASGAEAGVVAAAGPGGGPGETARGGRAEAEAAAGGCPTFGSVLGSARKRGEGGAGLGQGAPEAPGAAPMAAGALRGHRAGGGVLASCRRRAAVLGPSCVLFKEKGMFPFPTRMSCRFYLPLSCPLEPVTE